MKSTYILALYLLCFALNMKAQVQANVSVELSFKKNIRTELKAGQVDKYAIYLKQGQFATIRIKQETVGIGYWVYAPGDSLMVNADLNALYQTEVITIEAKKTGHYRVEVFWDYSRPQSGYYSIIWDKVEVTGKTEADKAGQLFQSWYDTDGPGAVVMVIKDQKVIFKITKGLANLEYKILLSESSALELASVSKQFTGFAIAMLVDKGRLSLDDSIRKFLPELPYVGKTITVRHLVDHTSGFRNWDDMMNASGYKREDLITMEMIFKMASTVRYLNFTPGEFFSYCNTGYNLLAIIVERLTGQSFSGWMRDNVFLPLGMNNTVIRDGIELVIPSRAYCYKAFKEGYNLIADNISAPGSSSVYSNIGDLLKWVNNFETGQVGGKNVLALIKTRDTLNNGKLLDYTFGNFIGQYKGVDRIEHLGLLAGFRTSIARFPDEKLSVIYLSNDANDATYERALTIANVFLKDIKREPLKLRPLPDIKEYLLKTGPLVPDKDTSDFSGYEGIYFARELNVSFTLKIIDNTLTILLPRADNIYLKKEKPDEFTTTFPDFTRRMVFRRDENKKITGFFLTTGGRDVLFSKMIN